MSQGFVNGSILTLDTDLQFTAFGDLQVAQETPFIQTNCVYNFFPTNFRQYSTGSGASGVENRMFKVNTGTTIYSYGAIQSFRSLNYNSGQGGQAKFTAIFENNVANSWSGVGLINLSDELSFGYDGTTFGIWHRYGGVAEVRTIEVTVASSGSTNLTLTLNGVANTIPLTAGTTAHNAYEIATWINTNNTIWVADQVGSTIILSSLSDGAKAGTYTYSHATSTGTITQNNAGVTKTSVHIPKSTWNVNQLTNWSSAHDPSKGNVYKIAYQYLGFGDIFFYVENPDTGSFELVHRIKWANANTRTNVNQPSLRAGLYAVSIGSTTDLVVRCASFSCAVQGKVFKTRNPRAVKNTQSVTTTATNIFTLRNRRTYNAFYNQVEVEPINISVSSESNQNVEIDIRTSAVFSGDTNFANTGTNLVTDIDTTANTVTNGTLLASFTLGAKGNISINLKDFEIRIPPSLQLTISARVTSGASSNITATLTYYEDI
jgi:hypothetical protein